jgi:hypothetical protein
MIYGPRSSDWLRLKNSELGTGSRKNTATFYRKRYRLPPLPDKEFELCPDR